MNYKAIVVALGLCSLVSPAPASAQLSRLGETFSVWAATSRGSAVAYDTRNNVYLVISAHGTVYGRFVSADGAVLGEPMVFQGAPGFGQFPQVAYSPDANNGTGAFLVTWHESDANIPSVHGRMVSYTSGFITADKQIVGNDTYHEIMGAPVVYSTVSKEFLVVWRQYTDVNIFGLRLNNNADAIGGPIPVATSALFESDPSLTYSPTTDEFLVIYRMGFSPTAVMAQRIKAGTGALVAAPTVVTQASTVNTTGVTFNPTTGQYLAAWHQMPGDVIVGRLLALDGTPLGSPTPISTRVGTYDSLSVDANEVAGTALVVGHDKLSVEVGGVEVNGAGTPLSNGEALTLAGGGGNHVPKVSSNPTRREFMVTAARNFAQTIAQRVYTASNGGNGPNPNPNPGPTCSYSINDSSATIGGTTFAGVLTVTTTSGCTWTAASTVSWLSVSPASGTGSSSVQWTAAANTSGSARSGSLQIAGRTLTVYQAGLAVQRFADFNADSFMDIVWQNDSTGQLAVWRMNGFTFTGGESFAPAVVSDTGWKIVAAIDIDRNGSTDLLWQHAQGWVAVWKMQGESRVSGELITASPLSDLAWRIVGTGDFNRDGWTDFLWQHIGNGAVAVWYMHGSTYLSGEVIAQPLSDQNWRIVGAADMNGDNNNDLVWHHGQTGQVSIWVMSGTQLVDGFLVNDSAPDTNWRIRGLGDFDGDADVDILWQNHSTGALAAWVMRSLRVDHGMMLGQAVPDTNWKIVAPR